MSESILHIKTADEAETVFYEAFMHCDIAVMAALWAKGAVVCVHPGSGVISGHTAVVRSWRHIFANANPAQIRYNIINKVASNNVAVHLVSEEIMDNGVTAAVVIATNVYQRFENGWLIVEHHASVMRQEQQGRTIN